MAKYLSKGDILGAQDARFEEVEAWGGLVRIKTMTGAEKDAFESSITSLKKNGNKMTSTPNMVNVRAKLLARCIVDENGALIFDASDIEALGAKSAAELDKLVDVAKRLNRMNEGDIKALADNLKNDQPAD